MSRISLLFTLALVAMVCCSISEAASVSKPQVDARTDGLKNSIGSLFNSIKQFKLEVVKVVFSPITFLVGKLSGASNTTASAVPATDPANLPLNTTITP